MSRPLFLAALALGLALPAAAQSAASLSTTSPRTLFETTDRIKGDDGARVTLHTLLTYDPVAGAYLYTVRDETGALVESRTLDMYTVGPTPDEEAAAQALIRSHAELASLIGAAEYPVEVVGGFPLVREAGHGCGPGSRCLQYDVYEVLDDKHARRVRYVVVDLRALRVFDADFDVVAEGNLAHPDARRQSRSRTLDR